MFEKINLTDDEIFQLLIEAGATQIIERENEPYIDFRDGNDSNVISAATCVESLVQNHAELIQEKAKIQQNEYWRHIAKSNIRHIPDFDLPKTDDLLTADEITQKKKRLYDITQKIDWNETHKKAYRQLIERYKAGRIKLPVDLVRYEREMKIIERFSKRFVSVLPEDSFNWLYDATSTRSGFTALENFHFSILMGISISEIQMLLDEEKFPYAKFSRWVIKIGFPRLKERIEQTDNEELNSIPTNETLLTINNTDQERDDLIEPTRAANIEAYRIATDYYDKGEQIPFFKIAEEVMSHHFIDLIKRETGAKMRNGEMELTKEWKNKREAIRGTLRQKF